MVLRDKQVLKRIHIAARPPETEDVPLIGHPGGRLRKEHGPLKRLPLRLACGVIAYKTTLSSFGNLAVMGRNGNRVATRRLRRHGPGKRSLSPRNISMNITPFGLSAGVGHV